MTGAPLTTADVGQPDSPAPRRSDGRAGGRGRLDVAAVPRLALSVEEACAALGVSWDFWAEHIADDVRIVRRGRRKLIAVAALQQWLAENSEKVLERR